jgi:undecaprenyl pyrophosphate phosphatase UppP
LYFIIIESRNKNKTPKINAISGISYKTALWVGTSLLKLIKLGLYFSGLEIEVLLSGMLIAFVVSIISIKFLMSYFRKHDFKVFGWYWIVLGIIGVV